MNTDGDATIVLENLKERTHLNCKSDQIKVVCIFNITKLTLG